MSAPSPTTRPASKAEVPGATPQDRLRDLLHILEMLAHERRDPQCAVRIFEQIFDLMRVQSRLESGDEDERANGDPVALAPSSGLSR
jgi:hypothetical protein